MVPDLSTRRCIPPHPGTSSYRSDAENRAESPTPRHTPRYPATRLCVTDTLPGGLRADEAAAGAALSEPWPNGQTEGQINKLKTLKLKMYGRANLDLLKARLVVAV